MKRFVAPLAGGMAALYLALAVGVAGCLSAHSDRTNPSHRHHQSHVTHSAFCAWACQANQTASELVEGPPAVLFKLVAILILVRVSLPVRLMAHVAHSRAPPR